ncbi:hypothetical protein K458DRAFT_188920 [Lentithecium fluviatile CBS 122367]|uniref:Uncharacterized protein n=1 Tax=Lentithecium fluviatile CBS 122367 TaxID=1168545 RepID=A0A6G1J9U8_9PLEO|nr:hypothetical protein K458DRAFT_188920 [Lentithecium fluviatile CBS 122367]
MAENEGIQNMDLQQILQTLASLSNVGNVPTQAQQQPYDPTQVQAPTESLSPAQTGIPYGHEQPSDPRLSARPPSLALQSQPLQTRPSAPTIDPATITTWKHGLRCVTKLASQNPNFAPTIRQMMKHQEQSVKGWESGRLQLVKDHTVKRQSEKRAREKNTLPGLVDNTPPLRTPEQEQKELQEYYWKVYWACAEMVEGMERQLKGLGVPFFGVRPHLILEDGAEQTEEEGQSGQEMGGKIKRKDMLELQRKMLNHLVEMYGD